MHEIECGRLERVVHDVMVADFEVGIVQGGEKLYVQISGDHVPMRPNATTEPGSHGPCSRPYFQTAPPGRHANGLQVLNGHGIEGRAKPGEAFVFCLPSMIKQICHCSSSRMPPFLWTPDQCSPFVNLRS